MTKIKISPFKLANYNITVYNAFLLNNNNVHCSTCKTSKYITFDGIVEDNECFTLFTNGYISLDYHDCLNENIYILCSIYNDDNLRKSAHILKENEWQFLKYYLSGKIKKEIYDYLSR